MKLNPLHIPIFLLTLMFVFSCNDTSVKDEGSFDEQIIIKTEGVGSNIHEEKRVWTIDGQKIAKVSKSIQLKGTSISVVEFPKELLKKDGAEISDEKISGKILLCEIKPEKKLIDYANKHNMTDDELMSYLAFDIQKRFRVVNNETHKSYPADGLIYEPSHGVSENEKFMLFFNNDEIFKNSYSFLYDDEFFGTGLTELMFNETHTNP